jgi:hypothetical protein
MGPIIDEGGHVKPPSTRLRLGWFVAIWAASVAALAVVAYAIRLILRA